MATQIWLLFPARDAGDWLASLQFTLPRLLPVEGYNLVVIALCLAVLTVLLINLVREFVKAS